MNLDEQTQKLLADLADEVMRAVGDRQLQFYEGCRVITAPVGATAQYITVRVEGINDNNIYWRGFPTGLAIGQDVLVWDNPLTRRREILAASGTGGVTSIAHNLLSATHTDTTAAAPVVGDMITGQAGPVWARVPVGAAHQLWKVNAGGTAPAWTAFDWDDMAACAGSDLVHDHSAAGEGGATINATTFGGVATVNAVWTHAANLVLDDGVGDSPELQFVGGSNDDTVHLYLADAPGAGDSHLYIDLPGGVASNSALTIRDALGNPIVAFRANLEDLFSSDINMAANKVVDLNGNADALVLDPDGDTTISAPNDDQIDIEIAGADDFTFTANSFNVLSGSYITMADDTWIGLGAAAGRLVFDSTPTPDEAVFYACNVGIGTSPGNGVHLIVQDSALNIDVPYYGQYNWHRKTAGASDHSDNFWGIYTLAELNQAGGEIGHLIGLGGFATATAGSIGDAGGNARSLYGGYFVSQVTGATVTDSVLGFLGIVSLTSGSAGGSVYGAWAQVDLEAGFTCSGHVYGQYIWVDVDQDPTGNVYMLYLDQYSGVDYALYHSGSAPSYFGGHVLPFNNKTQNLGGAGNRWNTLYQGTSTAAGTSRLVDSKRTCPVCQTQMMRGTGSLLVVGETTDYVLAHCPKCGCAAMEEVKHLPDEELSKREPPPKVELVGCHVFEMSGLSRQVRVDFRYTDDTFEETALPDGSKTLMRHPGKANSTYLGEMEAESFLTMTEEQRKAFLRTLGEREWYSLEEVRLMREQVAGTQANLDRLVSRLIGKDLLN